MYGPRERSLVAALAVLAVLAVFLVGAPRAAWAAPDETKQPPSELDISGYPTVSVTFDAPPGSVDALTVATVEEGGARRQATVQGAGYGGVEIVLVFDTSASMSGAPLQAVQAAANALVDRVPPGTKLAVVGYGERPVVLSRMTSDTSALHAALGTLQAGGEAALYDALSLGAAQFTSAKAPRTVILVSDGGNMARKATAEQVTRVLGDRGVRLYGVQVATSEIESTVLDAAVGQRRALDALAVGTNGRTVDARLGDELLATYDGIAAEALRRVRVTYSSNAHGQVPLVVRLTNGAVVRTLSLRVVLPSSNPLGPLGGGLAVFVGLFFLGLLAFIRPRRSLLATARRADHRPDGLRVMQGKAGAMMERSLERRGRRQALGARLERAGVALRPGEYAVIVGGAAAASFFFGMLVGGFLTGLVFGVLVYLVARLLLSSRTKKRRASLEHLLPDFLQQVTSGLRAGYGVMQAIDAASREVDAPMSEELRRLVAEVQLGRDATDSLQAMADRIGGQDVEWVVQAIEINREVGGDLVEVLDAVAETIRARGHLRRQVKTLSAQGRLSARILIAMPFVMAVILTLLSPGYLAPLVEESFGPFLLGIGLVLLMTGWLWLRSIVRPQF